MEVPIGGIGTAFCLVGLCCLNPCFSGSSYRSAAKTYQNLKTYKQVLILVLVEVPIGGLATIPSFRKANVLILVLVEVPIGGLQIGSQ